jgi:hypothetical protein
MVSLNLVAFYSMRVGNFVFFFRAPQMASPRNMIPTKTTGKTNGKI